MNPLIALRLFGGIAGLLVLACAAWLVKDRFHQKALADAARACSVAVEKPAQDLAPCLPPVRAAVEASRRAAACDAALLPTLRPETRFAMAQSCSAGVKRLVAGLDAADAVATDLANQLEQAEARQAAAVIRAEGRATRNSERTSHAAKAIASAPRDAGGNITCDAACLLQLGR